MGDAVNDMPAEDGDTPVEGIERAIFGEVGREHIDDWLDRLVQARLGRSVQDVFARAGRVTAVYGLRLDDGSRIAAKIHRHPVNVERLSAVVHCQRILSAEGFPCPAPVDGPATRDSRVVLIEEWQDRGELASAREPRIRLAMARALAEQVELLKSAKVTSLASHRPAWTRYESGPWPVPHDSFFDFTVTPAGYEWLDRLAQAASDLLVGTTFPEVIGHGDWVCQNMRFLHDAIAAAYDWDSLIQAAEPVIAGLSAGAYPEGGADDNDAPSPDEVALFLADYDAHRTSGFSVSEQAAAAAAATWVMAYNARCGVSAMEYGLTMKDGSPLRVLERYRDAYLSVRW